jgi:hypothetical protein
VRLTAAFLFYRCCVRTPGQGVFSHSLYPCCSGWLINELFFPCRGYRRLPAFSLWRLSG